MDPKDKLILTIVEDITKKPNEVNIQSTGVPEEEQIFFTEDDDETEHEMWERKQRAKQNLAIAESTITKDTMSTNTVNTEITNKSRLSKR